VGGITKAMKLLMIISDSDIAAEIQSWGNTLSQAVNLHLILANNETKYFEVPIPLDAYQFGFKDANLVNKGKTIPLNKPGIGIDIDWDILNEADYYKKIKVK
jgi:L-alanine-DL-glutamate epimerase-like enolase superfamily enzyme